MKSHWLITPLFIFAACCRPPWAEEKENPYIDTIMKEIEQSLRSDTGRSDFSDPGMWFASIVPNPLGADFQIKIWGVVNVGDPDAKLKLVKDTSASRKGELVLNLCAAPVNAWGMPTDAAYEERIAAPGKYKTARIMFDGKLVYLISEIKGAN